MILRDFLHKKTNAKELCIIREDGWIIVSCWIDYEDLFVIPQNLSQKAVKKMNGDILVLLMRITLKLKFLVII